MKSLFWRGVSQQGLCVFVFVGYKVAGFQEEGGLRCMALGFRVKGSGFRVQRSRFKVLG